MRGTLARLSHPVRAEADPLTPFHTPPRRPRAGFALLAALFVFSLIAGAPSVARGGDPDATAAPTSPPAPPRGDPWLEPMATGDDDPAPDPLSPDCTRSADPIPLADELLADHYQIGTWPAVTLPHDLSWTEDPYDDANWRYNLHTLRFLLDLVDAGLQTGDARYSDRALELAKDWVADNPRVGASADMAWNDHSTAHRAVVLSCLAARLPWPAWLEPALRVHGQTLADPGFYVGRGNHALNQAIGLIEVGRVLGQSDWIDLGADRINALVTVSVDEEGVINEQSISYQRYNWARYSVARSRLRAMGIPLAAAFARVDRMPRLLAYATLPFDRYDQLGDTSDEAAPPIPGTWAEYTATAGTAGPRPPTAIRRFGAGYLFARSGWGETRPFTEETALSIRWGPARRFHGHFDGGSVTLASWGERLILDSGLYAYRKGAYRTFMLSREAHNVVTVDGSAWRAASATKLVHVGTSARYLDVRLRQAGYRGVVNDRRVTWSRALDYVVVEDRLTSKDRHTYRQLWHLPPGSDPAVGTRAVRTRQAGGNVLVRQLTDGVRLRVVTGRTSPIQGWVSLAYATLQKAPVIEAIQRGRTVRYVTLLVPARGRPDVTVLSFATRPGGYALRIRVGGRTERLVVDGSTVRVTGG